MQLILLSVISVYVFAIGITACEKPDRNYDLKIELDDEEKASEKKG